MPNLQLRQFEESEMAGTVRYAKKELTCRMKTGKETLLEDETGRKSKPGIPRNAQCRIDEEVAMLGNSKEEKEERTRSEIASTTEFAKR